MPCIPIFLFSTFFKLPPNLAIGVALFDSFAFIKFFLAFDERDFYLDFSIFIIH